MGKKSAKRPLPSYEEGKFRDPDVAAMQNGRFGRSDLKKLVKKAVTGKAPKGASPQ